MKSKITLLVILTWLLVNCSRTFNPILISSEPLTNELILTDSAEQLIELWMNTWDSSGNGYFVRKISPFPTTINYFFAQLNEDVLTFVSFEQDSKTEKYTIHSAKYPFETWKQIDSLTAIFWTKPETIPIEYILHGGAITEMHGIKNNNRHKVFRTDAPTRDPEFSDAVNIISLHLCGNTVLKKYAEYNKH